MKALAVGVGTGIAAAVIWTTVAFARLFAQMAQAGRGGIGAVSDGIPLSLLFLIGFVLGVWWSLRRSRRKAMPGRIVLMVGFVMVGGSVSKLIADQPVRQMAAVHCADRRDLVGACFKTRGRISFYNGNPTFRMWPVGSHRLLGLEPSESPLAPENVRGFLKHLFEGNDLLGDFVVCPLSEERPGKMQQVCVESGSNLVLRAR